MLKKHIKKTQAGFTLIEIIAVLVILGILAAVAVPKYLDLQKEAADKALEGAVAAGQSALAMEYSRLILSYGVESNAWTDLKDFDINNSVETTGYAQDVTLNITGGGENNTITIYANTTDSNATGFFNRPD